MLYAMKMNTHTLCFYSQIINLLVFEFLSIMQYYILKTFIILESAIQKVIFLHVENHLNFLFYYIPPFQQRGTFHFSQAISTFFAP